VRVALFEIAGQGRSHVVCVAMEKGIQHCGDSVTRLYSHQYNGPNADVAVFYGYTEELRRVMRDYRRHGKAVYVDLGYWGRHEGGRRAGFHKIAVNGRHPTDYFMAKRFKPDRFRHFGIEIKPWRQGRKVIVAGMSAKAARAEGFMAEQWERQTIAELRKVTDRQIVYRPKPNWAGARPLEHAGYSHPTEPLEMALMDCHAIVTHHSNVAVDGLLAGVRCFAWDGVAKPMGLHDLAKIEAPAEPDNREEWAAAVAHTQWTVEEMMRGLPWQHLKDMELI
jgi:hypothetical protein